MIFAEGSRNWRFGILSALFIVSLWFCFRLWSFEFGMPIVEGITYGMLIGFLGAIVLFGAGDRAAASLQLSTLRSLATQSNQILVGSEELMRQMKDTKDEVRLGFERDVRDLRVALRQSTHELVYTVDREAVYQKLEYFARRANHRVYLMYFGKRPPSAYLKSTSKDSYVSELDAAIAEHRKNFRRIILFTQENKGWIEAVIRAHLGNDRFSLSIVHSGEEFPLMSAQVIDDDIAILMNLDPSSSLNKPRDIVIESKTIVEIVEKYYDDMFLKAVPVVSNGKLHTDNAKRFFGASLS